jgi:hypothetical protein
MAILFKYSKLFSLKVMHKYYANLLSEDFQFEASSDTVKKLARYGMVVRTNPTGFEIYGETRDDGKLKKSVQENLCLTFFARNTNAYLDNFTDLPLDKQSRTILYFNNKVANQVNVFGAGTQEFLLNKGSQVSASDYVNIFTSGYHFSHIAAGNDKVFRLIREADNIVVAEKTVTAQQGTFFYQNTLEGFDSGIYRLTIDGADSDRFNYQPDPAVRGAFAIVEIFTQVPSALKFITNGNEISARSCAVAFLNRSTLWRYKVTNRNGISLPNPAIAIGNNTGLFTNNGNLEFVSNATMPLQQTPVTGIRILKDKAILTSEALGNLSNASIDRLIPIKENGSYTLYSDIFIYL